MTEAEILNSLAADFNAEVKALCAKWIDNLARIGMARFAPYVIGYPLGTYAGQLAAVMDINVASSDTACGGDTFVDILIRAVRAEETTLRARVVGATPEETRANMHRLLGVTRPS